MKYLSMDLAILLALLAIQINTILCKDLIQGHIIWKHADRVSNYTYRGDPNKDKWKDFMVSNEGLSLEYGLGLFLKSKYGHLLSSKYKEGEIYFRSIETSRSLMGAQAVATGLYAKNTTKYSKDRTLFVPFPVHTQPESDDWLSQVCQDPSKGCPSYSKLISKIKEKSIWFNNIKKKYEIFLEKCSFKAGSTHPLTFDDMPALYDNLQNAKLNGNISSYWDKSDLNTIGVLSAISMGMEFTDLEKKYSKSLAKLRSGVILEHVLDNMKKRVEDHPVHSLVGYAGNGKSVTALLASMGAFNWNVPPAASCVMIDLYRDTEGIHSVEISYRNETSHEPYPVKFYECHHSCLWLNFKNIAESVITDMDTWKICGIPDVKDCCKYLFPGILFLMSPCILILPLYLCLKKLNAPKRETRRYTVLPLEETQTLREVKSL